MAVAQTHVGSTKAVIPLSFATNGFAASVTTGTIPIMVTSGGTLGVNNYTMPWDGSIVAMAARLPNAPSAGTLTLQPRINGSLCDFTVTKHVNSTDIQGFYARQEARKKNEHFTAGQQVGLSFTTASDWAAVQAGEFEIYVLLEGVEL